MYPMHTTPLAATTRGYSDSGRGVGAGEIRPLFELTRAGCRS
jgi:hypothetical protein